MAVRAEALHQCRCVDAVDRLFACSVDRRDEHHVGVVEGVLKLIHKRLKPREAMRLHHCDHAPLRTLSRCREHGTDLRWVVRVIVDNDGAICLADGSEPAFDTLKPFETRNYLSVRNAEL